MIFWTDSIYYIHTLLSAFSAHAFQASISSNFAAVVVTIPAIAARMQHPKIVTGNDFFSNKRALYRFLSWFNRVLLVAIPILSESISPIFMNSLVFRLYFSIQNAAKRFSVTQILWWNSHSLSTKTLLFYYIILCNVPTTRYYPITKPHMVLLAKRHFLILDQGKEHLRNLMDRNGSNLWRFSKRVFRCLYIYIGFSMHFTQVEPK